MDLQGRLYEIAKAQFKRECKDLIHEVYWSLKMNPHNTFNGTALDYVRKYKLAKKLRDEIFANYKLWYHKLYKP